MRALGLIKHLEFSLCKMYQWMFEEDYYKKERLSNGESEKNII